MKKVINIPERWEHCTNRYLRKSISEGIVVRQVLGYWIWINSSNEWICSECDGTNKEDTKYCPNCGCRMIDFTLSIFNINFVHRCNSIRSEVIRNSRN